MRRNYSVIFTFIIFSLSIAFAQENEDIMKDCKEEVCQINNLLLERTIIHPKAIVNYDTRFPSYRDVDENISYIYKDGGGRIRKFITMSNHPETSGYNIHYFNTGGELVYSCIYNQSYMTPHFYGYRYMSAGEQIFCDMDVYNEDADSWQRIVYSGGSLLLTYSNSFDNVLNADSVVPFCKSLYKIEAVFNYAPAVKVRFVYPEEGIKTFINARKVNIRMGDSMKNDVILIPLFGEIVQVIKKERKEFIEPYGSHNWFQVSVSGKIGYVFGAFLEPVEKEVE